MAKPKKRQLVKLPANKTSSPNGPIGSVKSKTKADLLGEDSWVIVKKQRVTILVPPLPVAKQSQMSNPGPSQPQTVPHETVNERSKFSNETCSQVHSAVEREKSTSPDPRLDIETTRKIPSAQPAPTLAKPPRLYTKMGSENPEEVGGFKPHRTLGPYNAAKSIHCPAVLLHEPISFPGGGVLLNRRMRALNLERKLQRAGGLSRWLALLGLGQFVKIFQGKRVDKFQLINLTMKKLKDMGADAVGPRRKLIHAIDCLCQPYCFEAI